ncbi:MAG: PilZ domain-containing protein [Myxococcota bacterium]
MARSSSTSLRAATDGPRALRLRGTDLRGAFDPGGPHEAARLRVRVRENLKLGEPVEVEVSFGPMADEVVLTGKVCRVHAPARGPLEVLIAIPKREGSRVRYVREILGGSRQASARRHRRIPVDIDVRWTSPQGRYVSRALDLSRGGAFIASRSLPSVGARVDVELRPASDDGGLSPAPLRLGAVVSWVRSQGHDTGFGVNFKLQDRDTAARLQDVVRTCEIQLGRS